MTGIFICLGTFPSFALCPVTKKLFQVKSTFSRSKLKAEFWRMQEQTRKGARAAEGQFGTGSNKLTGMKEEKCLKLPPKLSANLDSAQVNFFPSTGWLWLSSEYMSVCSSQRGWMLLSKNTVILPPCVFCCTVILSVSTSDLLFWLWLKKCQQVPEIPCFPLIV